jgi:hypothetical protein
MTAAALLICLPVLGGIRALQDRRTPGRRQRRSAVIFRKYFRADENSKCGQKIWVHISEIFSAFTDNESVATIRISSDCCADRARHGHHPGTVGTKLSAAFSEVPGSL